LCQYELTHSGLCSSVRRKSGGQNNLEKIVSFPDFLINENLNYLNILVDLIRPASMSGLAAGLYFQYNKKRRTKMGLFPVRPEKEKDLLERMARLGIKDSDLEERFVHSQGKGGQKVNKSATCVYLKHLPTGIEVKCQRERSQALNRFLARRILVEKLEEKLRGEETREKQKIEKIRRQNVRKEKDLKGPGKKCWPKKNTGLY